MLSLNYKIMKSNYKIKKRLLSSIVLSIALINITIVFLARDFGITLILVWISGSIPSLFVFYAIIFILKLAHIFRRFRHRSKPNHRENQTKQYSTLIAYRLVTTLIGGLVTSSVGVILYWLLLTPLQTVGLLSPVIDGLRKLSGQPQQYQEVYLLLIGQLISFLTAIPGMVAGKNLVLESSLDKHNH
jgi:hypothetical protein